MVILDWGPLFVLSVSMTSIALNREYDSSDAWAPHDGDSIYLLLGTQTAQRASSRVELLEQSSPHPMINDGSRAN